MLQVEFRPKFPPGRVVITANAARELSQEDVSLALRRHLRGDWGELEHADWQANERALLVGCRLLSAYTSQTGLRYWIISEPDRSATTILLPEDY
jgi:hypothetical protein